MAWLAIGWLTQLDGRVTCQLRVARADDSSKLSDLALRSKAVWGYDNEFLQACRAELCVTPTDIADADWPCMVAIGHSGAGERLIGFYLLRAMPAFAAELDALFVEPDCMGQGVGRRLLDHALGVLRLHHIKFVEIQSDPGAVGFYQRMGACQVGERASGSIVGRSLPVLQIAL